MIRLWFPKNFEESKKEDINSYIAECTLYLVSIKTILQNSINISKWNLLTPKLIDSKIILVQNPYKFLARRIPFQYVNNLTVSFDKNNSRCYYYVSDMVKCQYTANSLNEVVQLVEYGNDVIPPINWIRSSYIKFVDTIMENEE